MQYATRTRNAKLDAIETDIGTAPVLKIFGGAAKPALPATADAGTAITNAALPSDWLAAASGGAKAKAGTWQQTAGASGLLRYFRIYDSGATFCGIQGLVGQTWTISTPVVLNQHVNANGNCYIVTTAGTTNGSGTGPSGTGAGITNGTAVFDYVGPAEMAVDNSNVVNAQVITVTAFTITEGNP